MHQKVVFMHHLVLLLPTCKRGGAAAAEVKNEIDEHYKTCAKVSVRFIFTLYWRGVDALRY